MFAVIKSGGRQYKVAKDDVFALGKVSGAKGDIIVLDQVVALGDKDGKLTLGTPLIDGMKVSAEVIEQKKDDKVVVFKKKRRHNYRRKKGHRQEITILRIADIGKDLKPGKAAAPKKKEEKSEETKKPVEKEPVKKEAKETKAKEQSKPEEKKTASEKPKAKKAPAKQKIENKSKKEEKKKE